ncbi:MAG: peptidoglycan-binding protein LysM [Rhodothermales bacterium]
MGLLDFLKDAGEDLFGGKKGNEADVIRKKIEDELGSNVDNLGVLYKDGRVELHGNAKSQAAKEKAALLAGNVKGVNAVDDDGIKVAGQAAAAAPVAAPSTTYYTIEKGDSLSKIAQRFYGDPQKYHDLFDANREVIQDPDKIYPGQKIRIPNASGS